MTAAAHEHSFGEVVIDFFPRPAPLRPVASLSAEEKAAELQHLQRRRARLAAARTR
jgi:hypothetical protein